MGLSLRGSTSGAIDINPPAVAGDNAITLPASNGSANQFFKNSGTAGIVTYSSMVERVGNIGIGTQLPTDLIQISHNTNAAGITIKTTESYYAQFTGDSNRSGANSHLMTFEGHWNGTPVAEIAFRSGDDTTNKDDGQILFRTSSANNLGDSERLRIKSNGSIQITPEGSTDNPHLLIDTSGDNVRFNARKSSGNTNANDSGIIFVTENNSTETERIRINSDGVIGIGTAGTGSSFEMLLSGSQLNFGSNVRLRLHNTNDQGYSILDLKNDADKQAFVWLNGSETGGGAGNAAYGGPGAMLISSWAGPLIFGANSADDHVERLRISTDGAIGLSGANYGNAGQVIKSNGSSAAPTWQNLYSYFFYGQQDTETNIDTATYTSLKNLGTRSVALGDASIASWNESEGELTVGASGAGYWFLSCGAGIDDIQSGDYVQVVISKNGTDTALGTNVSTYGRSWNGSVANQVTVDNVSSIVELAANDVVRFYVYHNEGTTEPTEPNRTFAMGYRIGGTSG